LRISAIGLNLFVCGIGERTVLQISPIVFGERLISEGAINGVTSAIHFKNEERKTLVGGINLPGSDK
jgi:hypothetical protein